MRKPIDHESASEQLGPLARGELSAAARAPVEEHLRDCAECSAELRGLQALYVDRSEGLQPAEARELHRRVRDEIRPATVADVVSLAPREWWRSRFGQLAGAAALLAIVAVGIVYVTGSGLDSADEQATTAGSDDDEGASLESTFDQDKAGAGGGGKARGTARHRNADAVSAAQVGVPEPVWDHDAGPFTRQDLVELARHGSPFVDFARFFGAQDAESLRRDYLERLAAGAPDPDSVRECSTIVFESQPYAILPAYGSVAEVDDRESLVLGFVWTDRARGPLDRFSMWAWRDSACDSPPLYQFGRIEP